MEFVLYFEKKDEDKIKEILNAEPYVRGSYNIKDAKTLGYEREGNLLYYNHRDEVAKELKEKLKDLAGEIPEEREIIEKIKTEEEKASKGMGMVFG